MVQNNQANLAWIPLLMGICTAIGLYGGMRIKQPSQSQEITTSEAVHKASSEKWDLVLKYLHSKYKDSLNYTNINKLAIQEVLNALDPYSKYLDITDVEQVNKEISGQYKGIGIQFEVIDSTCFITQIIPHSPAAKTGLQIGDQIIAIEGNPVSKLAIIRDSVLSLLEKNAQTLQLTILNAQGKTDHTISKEKIKLSSVPIATLINPEVAYVKIQILGDDTYREFMEHIELLFGAQKAKHLILDLRGNRGGYLKVTVDILNQLIATKELVLISTKGKHSELKEYKSTGKAFFKIDKIAVLIDQESASGAEIIAGSLQEHKRAKIIGNVSLGKGIVLEQFPLQDGSAIRIATADYYLPSGKSVQKSYTDLADLVLDDESLSKDSLLSGGIIPDLIIPETNKIFLSNQELNKIVFSNWKCIQQQIQPNKSDFENHLVRSKLNSCLAHLKLAKETIIQIELLIGKLYFGEAYYIQQLATQENHLQACLEYFKQ